MVLDLALFVICDEGDRPAILARIFEQRDLAEGGRLLGQDGLEDLLGGAVDAADDRHLVEQALAGPDQEAADQAGGHRPDQGQEDK